MAREAPCFYEVPSELQASAAKRVKDRSCNGSVGTDVFLFRLSLGPVHCTSYAFKTHAAGEEVSELDRYSNKFSRRWILSHRPCYECLVRLGRRMGAGSLARASRRPASCSLVERNKHWKDGGDDLAKRSTSLRESGAPHCAKAASCDSGLHGN